MIITKGNIPIQQEKKQRENTTMMQEQFIKEYREGLLDLKGIVRMQFMDISENVFLNISGCFLNGLLLQKPIEKRISEWLVYVVKWLKVALQKGYYVGFNADIIERSKKNSAGMRITEIRIEPNVRYAYDLLKRKGIDFSIKLVYEDEWVKSYTSLQQYLKNIKGVTINFVMASGLKDQRNYGLGQLIEQQNDNAITKEMRRLLSDENVIDGEVRTKSFVWLNTKNYSMSGEMLIKTALKNFIKPYSTTDIDMELKKDIDFKNSDEAHND